MDRICAVNTFLCENNVRRSSCRWWKMRPRVEGEDNSGSNYTNNNDCLPKCRKTDLRHVAHDRRFVSVRLRSADVTRFSEKRDKRASHHCGDQGHNYEHGENPLREDTHIITY